MKKFLGPVSMVLALAVMLTAVACGGPTPSASSAPDAQSPAAPTASGSSDSAPAAAADEVKLAIAVNQSWNKQNFEPMIRKYEQQNPNVKIDIQVIPDGQFDELLNAKLRTGEAPDMVHYGMTQLFQKYNVPESLIPLDDEPWVKDLINPAGVTVGGKIYAAPSNSMGAASGLIYNVDLYKKHNLTLPKTWDEFISNCEKLKAAGIIPVMVPAKDAWTVGMWICTMFPNYLTDMGSDIYDKINVQDVKYADVKGFAESLDKMKLLVDKGYINADYLSTTVDMGLTMLMEEKAAMAVSGDYWISDASKNAPNVTLRMAPLPVVDNARLTCGTIRVNAIFKSTKNEEECRKFLRFLQEPEQQVATNSDWGTPPAMKGVTMDLPAWSVDVQENYVNKGLLPLEQMGMKQYVGAGELTNLTMEVLMGNMTSQKALEEWDVYYAKLAKEKKFPGWENK